MDIAEVSLCIMLSPVAASLGFCFYNHMGVIMVAFEMD